VTHDGVPQRILVSRMKFIGDVVLTTPVIRSLRAAFPDAFLAYMGDAAAVSLLQENPFLNQIIPFDFSRPTFLEQPRVTWLLRRLRFDWVIDLFGNPRSALLTYLTGAPVRVGLERKGRGRLYTLQVRDDGRPKSAVEFHLQFLRALGVEPVVHSPELFVTERERADAAAMILTDRPLVVLHPGATWPAKRWLPERFALLAGRLRAEKNVTVVLSGGPNEASLLDEIRKMADPAPEIVLGPSLRQLAALYARASVVVSNDAGPMHIAAAVGTPTIGIFGPGEEQIWFPYEPDQGHRALRKDVPCHPCHLDFCNRTGDGYMECMKLLSVEEVAFAVGVALKHGRR
jgi:lipopolysaccharide heptosyltransferase II